MRVLVTYGSTRRGTAADPAEILLWEMHATIAG